MCICIPRRYRFFSLAARSYTPSISSKAIPNLLSYVPVVILACVLASTFGFTRTAIGAFFFSRRAILLMRTSSGSLSALNA